MVSEKRIVFLSAPRGVSSESMSMNVRDLGSIISVKHSRTFRMRFFLKTARKEVNHIEARFLLHWSSSAKSERSFERTQQANLSGSYSSGLALFEHSGWRKKQHIKTRRSSWSITILMSAAASAVATSTTPPSSSSRFAGFFFISLFPLVLVVWRLFSFQCI